MEPVIHYEKYYEITYQNGYDNKVIHEKHKSSSFTITRIKDILKNKNINIHLYKITKETIDFRELI